MQKIVYFDTYNALLKRSVTDQYIVGIWQFHKSNIANEIKMS